MIGIQLVYLLIIFILPFIKKNTMSNKLIILEFVLLLAYIFLQRKTSLDYPTYVEYYHNSVYGGPIYFEKGFMFFNKIIYFFVGDNIDLVFLIYYGVMVYFIYKGIEFYIDDNITISLILFFLLSYLSGGMIFLIRQYIAIAIFIYATKYIINRNLKKYIIAILLGALIHKSLLIMFPLYWVLDFRNLKLITKVLVSSTILLSILLISVKIVEKYSGYMIKSDLEGNSIGIFSIYIFGLFTIYFWSNRKSDERKERLIRILGMFAVIGLILLSNLGFAQRIAFYFKPFLIIGVSKLCITLYSKQQLRELVYYLILCSNIILYGFQIL